MMHAHNNSNSTQDPGEHIKMVKMQMRIKQEEDIEVDNSSYEDPVAALLRSPYDASVTTDDLILLPEAQAKRLLFPPTCRVRILPGNDSSYTKYSLCGVVQQIQMNFSTREDLFMVQYDSYDAASLWPATDLAFAPQQTVWWCNATTDPDARVAAVILGTDYYPADDGCEADVLHSLLVVSDRPPRMIHHGIPARQLGFR
jgi:hypothetical protein